MDFTHQRYFTPSIAITMALIVAGCSAGGVNSKKAPAQSDGPVTLLCVAEKVEVNKGGGDVETLVGEDAKGFDTHYTIDLKALTATAARHRYTVSQTPTQLTLNSEEQDGTKRTVVIDRDDLKFTSWFMAGRPVFLFIDGEGTCKKVEAKAGNQI